MFRALRQEYDALTAWLRYGFLDEYAPAHDDADARRAAYAEFGTMLASLKLKDPGLAEARDLALRLCSRN